jgi:hypothetical protein
MAEAVVGGAFLGVLQDVVGLADLLEALLGAVVSGIAVRMIFHGQLAVGLLKVFRLGAAPHTEGFIVALLCH